MKRPKHVTPSTTKPDIRALVTAFRCWEELLTAEAQRGVNGGKQRFVGVNGGQKRRQDGSVNGYHGCHGSHLQNLILGVVMSTNEKHLAG